MSGLIYKSGRYLSLCKPNLIPLLVISMACPMVVAAGNEFPYVKLLAALVGGSLVVASANICNCVYDRDIDAIMNRTKSRPMPNGEISVFAALLFSAVLGIAGLAILALWTTKLAAFVSFCGHIYYSVIYTILLKRTTPQNIVIGGGAGAVPPLVGWAAITGSLPLVSWLLFLLIFLWTPPHFWALALVKSGDYKAANIPMMPLTHGEKVTVNQMFWYSLSLIPIPGIILLTDNHLGWFFFVIMTALGVVFSYLVYSLRREIYAEGAAKDAKSWKVFGFSLIYLSVFFASLVIDWAINRFL
mgnify:CR=1 FL=1